MIIKKQKLPKELKSTDYTGAGYFFAEGIVYLYDKTVTVGKSEIKVKCAAIYWNNIQGISQIPVTHYVKDISFEQLIKLERVAYYVKPYSDLPGAFNKMPSSIHLYLGEEIVIDSYMFGNCLTLGNVNPCSNLVSMAQFIDNNVFQDKRAITFENKES